MKEVDKRIDEGVLWWFSHVERMENDRIVNKGLCRRVCWQLLSDSVKENKVWISGNQEEWWRFVRGKCLGHSPGDEPFSLTRCHNYMNLFRGGSQSVAEPTTYRKSFFFSFLALLPFYCRSFHGMIHANPTWVGDGVV